MSDRLLHRGLQQRDLRRAHKARRLELAANDIARSEAILDHSLPKPNVLGGRSGSPPLTCETTVNIGRLFLATDAAPHDAFALSAWQASPAIGSDQCMPAIGVAKGSKPGMWPLVPPAGHGCDFPLDLSQSRSRQSLVSRFRSPQAFAASSERTSESKGH